MIDEKKMYRDGLLTTLGGVDSGRAANLLGANQLAFATNVRLRGGFAATAPRVTEKVFDFTDDEAEAWFEEHLLQGREFFYSLNGISRLIVSIGGRIFAIERGIVSGAEVFPVIEITPTGATELTNGGFVAPAVDGSVTFDVVSGGKIFAGYPVYVNGMTYVVTLVAANTITATNINDTPATVYADGTIVRFLDPNMPQLPKAWMRQAEQYMIIQNGVDAAIIYDGTTSRRSNSDNLEIPTGTAMVYNEEIGRIALAVAGNQIAIGDIETNNDPSTILKFEEETVLATGGRFKIPMKFGKIIALEMTSNLDRANGQGPMVCFAERGVSSFVLPANRLAWQNLTYPVQVNMPLRYSATSQEHVVSVNSDLYFRSPDGLRSLVWALREFQQPGNVPLSSEMAKVFDNDDPNQLIYGSSIVFDNRLLVTAAPSPSSNGTFHYGLVSLDFDLISRIGQKSPPTYDGMWTNVLIRSLVAGNFDRERAFIFALNASTFKNELWELHRETGFNQTGDTQVRIQSEIQTRAFDFQRPMELKRLDAVEVWMDEVVGEVLIVAEYRPDDYQCWFPINSKNLCQKFEDCTDDAPCKALQTFTKGYRSRIAFGMPRDEADPIDKKPARSGYHFQIRLAWKGQCRIRKVLVRSGWLEESFWNVDKSQ